MSLLTDREAFLKREREKTEKDEAELQAEIEDMERSIHGKYKDKMPFTMFFKVRLFINMWNYYTHKALLSKRILWIDIHLYMIT